MIRVKTVLTLISIGAAVPSQVLNLEWNGFGSSFMGRTGIGAENLTREDL